MSKQQPFSARLSGSMSQRGKSGWEDYLDVGIFNPLQRLFVLNITPLSTAPCRSAFWCHRSRTFSNNIGHCSCERVTSIAVYQAHRCTATSFGPYSDGPWWSVFRRSAAYWALKSFWTTTTDPCITHGPQQDVLGTLCPMHQRFLGQ